MSAFYYTLNDANGQLRHGSPCLIETEQRRASLIAENELRLDLVRCGFHSSMKYPMPPRQKMAVIRSTRNHMAILKSELKHWKFATVEIA